MRHATFHLRQLTTFSSSFIYPISMTLYQKTSSKASTNQQGFPAIHDDKVHSLINSKADNWKTTLSVYQTSTHPSLKLQHTTRPSSRPSYLCQKHRYLCHPILLIFFFLSCILCATTRHAVRFAIQGSRFGTCSYTHIDAGTSSEATV